MHFIEKIVKEGVTYLKPGGWLLIEMNPDQTERTLCLIEKTPCLSNEERIMDYRKQYRMVKAQKGNG